MSHYNNGNNNSNNSNNNSNSRQGNNSPNYYLNNTAHVSRNDANYNPNPNPNTIPHPHQQYYNNTNPPNANQNPHININSPYNNPSSSSFPTGTSPSLFSSTPTAQLGLQLGQQMFSAGQDYLQRNLMEINGSSIGHAGNNANVAGHPSINASKLKNYFDVTNVYVIKKLAIILFPWTHRDWMRAPAGSSTPRHDINSPDLYIPLMAVVTFVLGVGMVLGLSREFSTERIVGTATGAIIFIALELLVVKVGAYILGIGGGELMIVDVLAIIGYNFVPLICVLAIGWVFGGGWIKFVSFLYGGSAMGFFMLRSLKNSFLPPANNSPAYVGMAGGGDGGKRERRIRVYFLFGVVFVQIVCSYFLLLI